jgi:nucleoside-triphosphatase THEP1
MSVDLALATEGHEDAAPAPLGAVIYEDGVAADAFLAGTADELRARGFNTAGVVQANDLRADGMRCDMTLVELSSGEQIRLSQNLGAAAKGCKLDPAGLVHAATLIESALSRGGIDLVVVNKFGKQEASGEGLRDVLAEALILGVPVLLGVSALNLSACASFAAESFSPLPMEQSAVMAWCEAHARRR